MRVKLLRWWWLGLAAVPAGLILIVMAVAIPYFMAFLRTSGAKPTDLVKSVREGVSDRNTVSEQTNFLLLGLDERSDSLERTLLTDTMIFASLNLPSHKLTMISLPRDLWDDALKTKINAFYYYGTKSEGVDGLAYTLKKVEEIIDQPIAYGLVLNYAKFPELIDALGGIDITVAQAFTDNEYPNPAYTGATESAEPIYLTVNFKAGQTHLNGARALQYVRSRNSPDPEEGSDLARSSRQVDVFKALLTRLTNQKILLNPEVTGFLYRFHKEGIETNLSDSNAIALLFKLWPPKALQIESKKITTDDSQISDPILVHPPIYKYRQWVWEPALGNWDELRQFIKEAIR